MNPGRILWQCRRCEKVIEGANPFQGREAWALRAAMELESGQAVPSTYRLHDCSPGEIGIADLIGASETKEEKE